MEKKYVHKNGKTYIVRDVVGVRRFFDENDMPLAGLELNVVRNAYNKEHPMPIIVSASDDESKVGSGLPRKHIFRSDCISARTHADFLNQLLGLNLKGWQRSSREYDEQLIWMVRFDDGEIRDGWQNFLIREDECCQVNAEHTATWDGKDICKSLDADRIVFRIKDGRNDRTYTFLGVFRYEASKSNPRDRVYFKKIADEFEFKYKG